MSKISSPISADLFERAQKVLPGGVSRNTLLRGKHPLYVKNAKGCKVFDVDGVERIDFANNMASHIHGHAFEPIVSAVSEQLKQGTAFTMATEAEILFAEHLCSRSESFEKIRFVNSGTEAVMAGMKAARAFTGRTKIAKVEGSYHGAYDYAEVSQAPNPSNWGDLERPNPVPLAHGTPSSVIEDVIILPFNEPEQAAAILDEYKDEIACVIIDPIPHRIGMVPVKAEFAKALSEWTSTHGAILMFDEVITYRSEYGGMQEQLGVTPDLTSMGKMIGGGFPVGALAGHADVMGVFTKGERGLLLPHSGTFSANPVTMTAGLVAMEIFDRDAVSKINKLGDYTRASLKDVFKTADIPGSVTGAGSLFRIHLKENAPTNYRETHPTEKEAKALSAFIDELYDEGIMMIHTASGTLSTPMDESVIDQFTDAVYKSLIKVKPILA
ncbi:MAG: aspartate aminotransferase family protein [Gammaproteobacteria bacterium]|nr:aspartate aminotransferase family protein [Gammaproteobacteria bacterium]